jgi:hypothetical protein
MDERHQRQYGKLHRGATHLLDWLKGREDGWCSLVSVVRSHGDK